MACNKYAAEPIFDRPKLYDKDQGWLKTGDGVAEHVWTIDPIFLLSFLDHLGTVETKGKKQSGTMRRC